MLRGYSAFHLGTTPPYAPIPILLGGTRGSSGGANRNGFGIYSVFGDPNGKITESPGALALNHGGGGASTLFIKESGVNTNTGWVPK